jgi:hypothetical protein
MKFKLFVIASLLIGTAAHADLVLNSNPNGKDFISENGLSRAVISLNEKRIHVSNGEEKLYSIRLDSQALREGDIFISNDGLSLVWLLKPAFPRTVTSLESITGLIAYRKGKRAFALPAKRIFGDRLSFLQQTTAHTRWLKAQTIDFSVNQIRLETKSFRRLVISLRNGAILVESDEDTWLNAEAIIEGEVNCKASGETQAELSWSCVASIDKWWKNSGPNKISTAWPSLTPPSTKNDTFRAAERLFILGNNSGTQSWSIKNTLSQ